MDTNDRLDIIDVTTRMGWYADTREWDQLVEIFTDTVDVDYTSLTGGHPAAVAPGDLVSGWKQGLGGLDATQHHVSNHLVTPIDDTTATVTAQFIATHRLNTPHGDPLWTLGGHYRFRVVKDDEAWRIAAVTMSATWSTGNQNIMTLAAQS